MLTSSVICVALGVYFEARSEIELAQRAVAHVILNRSEGANKKTCKEVYAPNQFTWTKSVPRYDQPADEGFLKSPKFTGRYKVGSLDAWDKALEIAKQESSRWKGTHPRIKYFHSHKKTPIWAVGLTKQKKIGSLSFYSGGKS